MQAEGGVKDEPRMRHMCENMVLLTEMRKSSGEWEDSSAIKKMSDICGFRQITQAFYQDWNKL